MHIGAISSVFIDRPLREAAERMQALGLESIEIGVGGYFRKTHCDPSRLLADPSALAQFQATLAEFNLTLSAFAIHGQPLHPDPAVAGQWDKDFRDACELASRIGLTRFTLLSGCPEGVPGDKEPNWITYPFPPSNMEHLEWQWTERLIPFWKKYGKIAEDHGVRLCFEMVAGEMVFKPETLLRLRDAVGPVIGCNFDPSHLFWQGIDAIDVIRALGDVIYHVHAKDSQVQPQTARINGVIDQKTFQDLRNRTWLFRTVGYGHDEFFWRDFVSALRIIGYDDTLSIEHEDPLIDPEEGFELAVATLQRVVIRKPPARLWYE